MAIVDTYFKKEEHRITHKNGGRSSQIDYILCRRRISKEFINCKAVPVKSIASQHRVLIGKMSLEVEEVNQALGEEEDRWTEVVREKAKNVLGVTSGRRKKDKDKVQDSIHRKRQAIKNLDRQREEKSNQEYKEMRNLEKKEVDKAKEKAFDELRGSLRTNIVSYQEEGEKRGAVVFYEEVRSGREVCEGGKDENETAVRDAAGMTNAFKVEVGFVPRIDF
ncbi:craniofacial development protein 2-like [Penaeus vannamei]|uniref:craniofacial development protein 2-like n=1 Tax=Penaeus vannamei TaxID=6689 RepID=UPI00387F7DEE